MSEMRRAQGLKARTSGGNETIAAWAAPRSGKGPYTTMCQSWPFRCVVTQAALAPKAWRPRKPDTVSRLALPMSCKT